MIKTLYVLNSKVAIIHEKVANQRYEINFLKDNINLPFFTISETNYYIDFIISVSINCINDMDLYIKVQRSFVGKHYYVTISASKNFYIIKTIKNISI